MNATVLLVDDCKSALELLQEDFEAAGFRVVLAYDGVEGWERFQAEKPDFVITDVRMPRANGFDLLERIRACATTPVVMLTAHPERAYALLARSGGAREYLHFPNDLARLIPLAKQLIAEQRADASVADAACASALPTARTSTV